VKGRVGFIPALKGGAFSLPLRESLYLPMVRFDPCGLARDCSFAVDPD